MRIAAHLGVLDEVELIDPVIDHLAAIGVDHVVCFDMGSRDGTLAALERRVGPAFELVRLRNDTPWAQLQALTIEHVRRTGADWVLFLDGDEFWLPAAGSLRPWLAEQALDIVTVPRFNVVLGVDGPALPLPPTRAGYADTWLHARRYPDFRQHLIDHPDTPWIAGVPVAKVAGRMEFIEAVAMGGHDLVLSDGRSARRGVATDALVAHVPFTSLARFERRVANVCEFLELSPDYLHGHEGWHWRRLHEIARQGGVATEFRHQITGPVRLARLRADGAVRSAADLLAT